MGGPSQSAGVGWTWKVRLLSEDFRSPALWPPYAEASLVPSAMMKNQQEWGSAPRMDGSQDRRAGIHEPRHSAFTEEPNDTLL